VKRPRWKKRDRAGSRSCERPAVEDEGERIKPPTDHRDSRTSPARIIDDRTMHRGRTRSVSPQATIPTVSAEEIRRLHQLAGSPMPSIHLPDIAGNSVDLAHLSPGWAALYLYPGTTATPATGADAPAEDVAQHRAFCARTDSFTEMSVRLVGVSSQSEQEQRQTMVDHRICHLMLIDTELALAEALGVPTFELAGRRWYRRVNVLIRGKTIEWASLATGAANTPAQVLTWLQLHGVAGG
jgi:peroxiredoxin